MDWLHSYGTLRRHPKTRKLARLLGVKVPEAIGHLHCLWWWSMEYAPDGDLTDIDPDVIADAAAWEGDPQQLIDALVNATKERGGAGFLENDGRLVIHDHEEYIGRYLTKASKDAARKRAERAGRARDDHSLSNVRPSDVRKTSSGRPADGAGRLKQTEEKDRTPPTPPPVDNSAEAVAAEDSQQDLPEIPDAVRKPVAKIVGAKAAADLAVPGTDLRLAVSRYVALIDDLADKALAEQGDEDRAAAKDRCRRVAFQRLAATNATKPIGNLPAYLTTAAARATGLGDLVGDALVRELRTESRPKRNGKGEPRHIADVLADTEQACEPADKFPAEVAS